METRILRGTVGTALPYKVRLLYTGYTITSITNLLPVAKGKRTALLSEMQKSEPHTSGPWKHLAARLFWTSGSGMQAHLAGVGRSYT